MIPHNPTTPHDTFQGNSPDGDGLVHLAIDEIFKQLSNKAVSIGGWGVWLRGGTLFFVFLLVPKPKYPNLP